ncbi:MAG: FtsX-like permease family protein [Chloroflexi bacterium]|nr:MAG: FtsX-like permease family protein [Chloroflexota bacterium]
MATFFLLLGLFSIAAGMLLIIMIFVMLAAERKSEMGMARAVGMKRNHLVQMFLSEGMSYNLASAMVGAGLGILVAFGMAYVMSAIFANSDFPLSIKPHFTLRSLVISYCLGVVLTFLTVGFSSWRVSNLNIVAAIRGTAEDRRAEEETKSDWRWIAASLPAMVIPPLGLWLLFHKGLGYRGSWRWVAGSIPAMIVPPLGIWLLLRNGFGIPSHWIVSVGGLLFGGLLFLLGINAGSAFPFALGLSLMTAGAARLLTLLKAPERPVYTVSGVFLLVMWGMTAGDRLEAIFGRLSGGPEMFFLSGVAMVAASTFVVIYNSDLILALVTRFGGLFGSILPAIRTAVAYPLANRFRTGMTLAMISLVVFALTMMSTMNLNFQKLFLDDSSRGGWDVVVDTNPNNPIPDLPAALRAAGSSVEDGFAAVGRAGSGKGISSTEARQREDARYDDYPVKGVDKSFTDNGHIPLESRAQGYTSDEAVWQAMATRDDVAVVDAFATRSGGFGRRDEFDFKVSGVTEGEDYFDPITLEIHDPASDRLRKVELIGVLSTGASSNFLGLYVPDSAFQAVYGEPAKSQIYVSLKDSDQSKDTAKEIEASLLTAGVQADSLKAIADERTAVTRNFFYLMQAFMGLGLFVGIAAVGVIAFRTVVERRQQIGMLRAIGYKRGTVALSFLLESSFVTLLSIVSGVGLAIWLSYFLLSSDEFATQHGGYYVPWWQIILFAAFTYLASMVMTWIPARQAASIPTAEALRYE